MQFNWKLAAAGLALVCGTALVTSQVVRAQQKQDKKTEAAPEGMDAEMLAKMMALGTPGPEHKELMADAGKWEETYKMRMGPDAPWTESKGTSEAKPLLDGRYLMQNTSGDMMGMQFHGIQIIGFDNMSKEYIALWMDSMSTWWVTTRGKKDKDGKLEMKGTMVDIAGSRPFRMVMQRKGPDLNEVAMYDTIPGKGEIEMMTIVSKRVK